MSEGGQDRGDSELNVRHGELDGAGDVERPNTRLLHLEQRLGWHWAGGASHVPPY